MNSTKKLFFDNRNDMANWFHANAVSNISCVGDSIRHTGFTIYYCKTANENCICYISSIADDWM